MSIKLNKSNGKYWVSYFVENHNHPLLRQECTHMLPSHRRIYASQATEVDLTEESGIPLRQAYELMEGKLVEENLLDISNKIKKITFGQRGKENFHMQKQEAY